MQLQQPKNIGINSKAWKEVTFLATDYGLKLQFCKHPDDGLKLQIWKFWHGESQKPLRSTLLYTISDDEISAKEPNLPTHPLKNSISFSTRAELRKISTLPKAAISFIDTADLNEIFQL
ncbi:hypothetical protein LOK49_LG11G00604 [Camellia lanceoleosa]|uniref:Uncharacterized protein n=1 Tax=Camellia lanceoleosa TaxID=1840588 RepID=A0ACC0G3B8_9ERIC|nr:hypothetical protein LOK49_LG11G00604 [Camellia lanceoleosa]